MAKKTVKKSGKKPSIKLKKFEGTIEDFVKQIGIGEKNAIYLKKNRGSNLQKLWWEDKEKWFCNWGECKTTNTKPEKVPWIISKDLPHHIYYHMRYFELYMYLENK